MDTSSIESLFDWVVAQRVCQFVRVDRLAGRWKEFWSLQPQKGNSIFCRRFLHGGDKQKMEKNSAIFSNYPQGDCDLTRMRKRKNGRGEAKEIVELRFSSDPDKFSTWYIHCLSHCITIVGFLPNLLCRPVCSGSCRWFFRTDMIMWRQNYEGGGLSSAKENGEKNLSNNNNNKDNNKGSPIDLGQKLHHDRLDQSESFSLKEGRRK